MKRTLIYFLIIPVLFISCSVDKERRNDILRMNLNGQVKSVKEISYEAIDLFGLIVKGDRKRENFLESDFCMVFNIDGNVAEEINYSSIGSPVSKIIYMYDQKGNPVEKNKFDSEGMLHNRYIAEFDRKGKKVEEICYDASGNVEYRKTFKYNRKTNLTEEKEFISDGKLDYRIIYRYDKKGNQTEECRYDSKNSKTLQIIFQYDSTGIAKKYFDAGGNLGGKDYYKYDNHGFLIEKDLFSPSGSIFARWEYKYESDNRGNWIKRTDYLNGKPKYQIEREIEYFDNLAEPIAGDSGKKN